MLDLGALSLATEAWPAVFAGFIPVIGLAAGAYLIFRASRNDGKDDE